MLSRLKSLPLTIVLTILIWMYAEAQFTSLRDNVRLTVKVLSPSADLTIRVIDAQGSPRSLASIIVTLQGPKDQIDRIYQLAQNATSPDDEFSSLTFVPPLRNLQNKGAASAGEDNTLDTLGMLNSLPYFRKRGVVITAAVPARIKLEVDTLERVSKTLDFRPSVSVSHFSLSPEQVVVSVPARTLQELGGAEKVTVAALPQRDLATLPPDTDQSVAVRYKPEYPGPQDDRVTVIPATGNVAVRLPRRQGSTEVVPEVPIWIAGPPTMLAKYEVDLRTKLVRVTVAGSAGAIGQLRQRLMSAPAPEAATSPAPSHGLRAYLDMAPDDRPAETFSTRRLRYVLPEGLTLQEAPVDIEFRLVERRAPATQPVPAR